MEVGIREEDRGTGRRGEIGLNDTGRTLIMGLNRFAEFFDGNHTGTLSMNLSHYHPALIAPTHFAPSPSPPQSPRHPPIFPVLIQLSPYTGMAAP